jgi:hypothetical protein
MAFAEFGRKTLNPTKIVCGDHQKPKIGAARQCVSLAKAAG